MKEDLLGTAAALWPLIRIHRLRRPSINKLNHHSPKTPTNHQKQNIDLQTGELLSEFDTILFGLTVIPIVGWFKLLPTFGGRVISIADGVRVCRG